MAGLLNCELNVLNIGINSFFTALEKQNIKVLHVEWRPPVEDDDKIDELLKLLL